MFMFTFEIFCLKGILVAYVLYFETPAHYYHQWRIWFSWLLEDTPVSGQNRLSLPSSNKVGRVSLIVCRIVKTGFIIWKTRKYHCGECKSNLNIWCTFSSMKEMWIMVQARYGSCTHNNKLWLGKKSKLSLHTVELKRVKSVFAASRLF